MNDEIHGIIATIDNILLNEGNLSADQIGSYIVGATIVRDDYSYYQESYPLLAEVAELAADLETQSGTGHEEKVLAELKQRYEDLKNQLKLQ